MLWKGIKSDKETEMKGVKGAGWRWETDIIYRLHIDMGDKVVQ